MIRITRSWTSLNKFVWWWCHWLVILTERSDRKSSCQSAKHFLGMSSSTCSFLFWSTRYRVTSSEPQCSSDNVPTVTACFEFAYWTAWIVRARFLSAYTYVLPVCRAKQQIRNMWEQALITCQVWRWGNNLTDWESCFSLSFTSWLSLSVSFEIHV